MASGTFFVIAKEIIPETLKHEINVFIAKIRTRCRTRSSPQPN